MKIKEIELNNFRIYNGKNVIDLTTSDARNIVIVSGENGFGKTTFLMSIVWCLYGKQMEQVDEMYKKEIGSKSGGYGGYMKSCLNKTAEASGSSKFSVSLTLTGLDMPEAIHCNEVKITRSYDTKNASGDDLLILFDGKQIDEIFPTVPKEERIDAEEYFIRERIMPIEIAKFFFFDAERIVAYSEFDSDEQREKLALAYSQVLGIQKYESLKDTLNSIKDDYRKKGVNSKEREDYNALCFAIENSKQELDDLAENIEALQREIEERQTESDDIQKRLLLEGNTMTQEQLESFRTELKKLKEEMSGAQFGLKELYNFIPFGLSGELFAQLIDQVAKETEHRQNQIQLENVDVRMNDLLNDLDEQSQNVDFPIDRKIRRFYEDAVKSLILKHFYDTTKNDNDPNFEELHGMTEVQSATLMSLVSKVKGAKKEFSILYDQYQRAKREHFSIEQQIRDAEARAESPVIKQLKQEKDSIDSQITQLNNDLIEAKSNQKAKSEAVIANKKKKEVLSTKIQIADAYKDKDRVLTDLINSINTFLTKFKEEKKESLQKRIFLHLQNLLHKKGLIKNVQVFIRSNMVDISLIGHDGKILDVSDLSNGERQMFSTALLSALVEETGIQFPVFIDSPLQKFDSSHSKNILEKFYPSVSEQVVLFPLLHKELTEKEYALIVDRTESAVLIVNNEEGSHFQPIKKENLFTM